jgi:hypothetical protein
MADPKHPEHLDDPESIPVLTDVIVPGRPPTPRRSEAHAPAVPQRAEEAPAAPKTSAQPAGSAPAATAAPPAAGEPGAQAGTPVRAATEPARESFERRETVESAQASGFVEAQPTSPARPSEAHRSADPLPSAEPPELADAMATHPTELTELTERDADHIAERLRGRFADYLREEGRRVIEARCREALDEHASWLIRQVTREVAHALEGEVAGWVRDAVRAELAAHQSQRR